MPDASMQQLTLPSLLSTSPEEDSGSDTADRYEFQHHCVARHCLDLLRSSADLVAVICEWHTDYILLWSDGSHALLSVKHREHSQGPWTRARLMADGGLGTLFERWRKHGRTAECRFVTNGGLDADCRRLADACATGEESQLLDEAAYFAAGLKVTAADMRAFLMSLRLDAGLPERRFVRVVNIEEYARPLLRELRLDVRAAAPCYDAVVDLARAAARAAGGGDGPPTVSAPGALDAENQVKVAVAKRTISVDQVKAAFQLAGPAAAEPPLAIGVEATRLTVKLREGSLGETTVSAARRSRLSWTLYERGMAAPVPDPLDPLGDVSAALREAVLYEASAAERLAREEVGVADDRPFGARMFSILEDRLAALARTPRALGVDPRLLMGLAFDLTAQCEVWWSPDFDVDQALLSAQQVA